MTLKPGYAGLRLLFLVCVFTGAPGCNLLPEPAATGNGEDEGDLIDVTHEGAWEAGQQRGPL
ncbi:MAG: hypothetical protein ACYSVY_09115 [Planctomycetota bacterium]|jgi:hypothetical protein